MVKFRGRTVIRSSERRRAEEKNSRVTLVLAVSSKPGPLQIKGSGARHLKLALSRSNQSPAAQSNRERPVCPRLSKSKKAVFHGTRVAKPIEISAFVPVPAIRFFRSNDEMPLSGWFVEYLRASTHPCSGWCPRLDYFLNFRSHEKKRPLIFLHTITAPDKIKK
jgi:hypothetical protein